MPAMQRPTTQQIEKWAEQYGNGDTLQVISANSGYSVPTISKYLKALGVKVASKGRRNKKTLAAVNPNPNPTEQQVAASTPVADAEEDLFDF